MMNNKTKSNTSLDDTTSTSHRVKVWDLPTRLFHWALVALVAVSFVTGKTGGTAMEYHEWSGVAVLVLLLFRIVWGVVGGRESRFKAFLKGPKTVGRYAATLLKQQPERHLGHNPLGGWSVMLLLGSLFIQAGTGLFANDDILTEGPLYDLVGKNVSDWLTSIHYLNQTFLLGLIAIHVVAIFFYLIFKRDNLIFPMINGHKFWHRAAHPSLGALWKAAAIIVLAALAVYLIIY